jgi:hypothetical protein
MRGRRRRMDASLSLMSKGFDTSSINQQVSGNRILHNGKRVPRPSLPPPPPKTSTKAPAPKQQYFMYKDEDGNVKFEDEHGNPVSPPEGYIIQEVSPTDKEEEEEVVEERPKSKENGVIHRPIPMRYDPPLKIHNDDEEEEDDDDEEEEEGEKESVPPTPTHTPVLFSQQKERISDTRQNPWVVTSRPNLPMTAATMVSPSKPNIVFGMHKSFEELFESISHAKSSANPDGDILSEDTLEKYGRTASFYAMQDVFYAANKMRKMPTFDLQAFDIVDFYQSNAVRSTEMIPSKEARDNMSRLIRLHGGHSMCSGVVWMPNGCKMHKRLPPSGFAFGVSTSMPKDIPMHHDLLNSHKFCYGTFAVRVNPDVGILDSIRATSEDDIATILRESPYMERARSEFKQGRGSYAGIYLSTDRGGLWSPDVWVVVQCGNEAKSQQFYEIVQKAQSLDQERKASSPPSGKEESEIHATWYNVLFGGIGDAPKAVEIQREIQDTRMLIALDVIHALGFEHITSKQMLAMPNVDTMTNFFSFDDDTQSFVYYAGCTSVGKSTKHRDSELVTSSKKRHTGAVIVQETPRKGPVILCGPPIGDEILGGTWRSISGAFNAFPCVTGRIKELKRGDKSISVPGFTWANDNGTDGHPRLDDSIYRERDYSMKAVESALGRNSNWDTIYLRPRSVFMCPPPQKTLLDVYST